MPNDLTAEQAEIRRKGRQRLIGAVALALAAVVFVPMVLDPEPRRERVEPLLAIPPKDGASPLASAPKAPEPVSATAAPAAPAPAAEGAAPKTEAAPATSARKTVEPKAAEFASAAPKAAVPKAASEPKADAAPQKPAAAAPKLEGFAVQVGAFKDEAKLGQAREKLAAARLPHYTERLGGTSGDLTRLRAGPFPTREAAEKAASQLKRAGLDGRVVPLP